MVLTGPPEKRHPRHQLEAPLCIRLRREIVLDFTRSKLPGSLIISLVSLKTSLPALYHSFCVSSFPFLPPTPWR